MKSKMRNTTYAMCMVLAMCCAGILGFCVGQAEVVERQKDEEYAEETARVMEFKNAYIECEESVQEYVNQSRYMVCLEDMVELGEALFKCGEREGCFHIEIQTCENALARLRRDTEACQERLLILETADRLRVHNNR